MSPWRNYTVMVLERIKQRTIPENQMGWGKGGGDHDHIMESNC